MKKILIRILGALFLLGAVFIMFATPWLQINDIKKKDLREFRELINAELDMTQETLTEMVEYDEDYEYDLKDNDLPSQKGAIKRRIKDVRSLMESLLDAKISLQDVTLLSFKAPGLIEDTDNFLATEYAAEVIFEQSELVVAEDVEDPLDSVGDFAMVFYLVGACVVLLVVLGVVSAVCHCLNKARFIKYIYIAFMVLLVVGLCVALPMISDIIQNEGTLTEGAEDVTIGITAMPFIAVVLTFVPVVLDIIFERKNKKTEEQING